MPPTLAEVKQLHAGQAEERKAWAIEQSGLLKTAAVSSEKLTGSAEWDRFLQQVQPWLDEARTESILWLERLSGALTDADVRVAQFHYHAAKAIVVTLEKVIDLPHTIVKAHRES